MARRSDHTQEELKAMVIAAGQEIIAAQGFSQFSARKVAKKIGYTVGTVYNVFGSHDELILHINAVTLDDIRESIANCIDNELAGRTQIKHLASCYLGFAKDHNTRWSALFEHRLSSDVPLPNWYSDKIKSLFACIEAPLQSIAGNEKNAQLAAKTLWASIHGICQLGLTGKLDVVGAESVRVLTDSMIDHYFVGLSHGTT